MTGKCARRRPQTAGNGLVQSAGSDHLPAQQYAAAFRAPYRGTNSLIPNQTRETWDVTFYAGIRPWKGGEFWINPEIDQGFGLSSTLGVAGFSSGEAYKIGSATPYARIPRAFFRQTFDLGGKRRRSTATSIFAGTQTNDRIVLTLDKFAVTDVFDTNKYAHDPRKDFMNWSLVNTGTFDYAADAWGLHLRRSARMVPGLVDDTRRPLRFVQGAQ